MKKLKAKKRRVKQSMKKNPPSAAVCQALSLERIGGLSRQRHIPPRAIQTGKPTACGAWNS